MSQYPFDAKPNGAYSTLSNSPGTGGTSFVVQTGQGARFAATANATVRAVGTMFPFEIVRVTNVSTDTLTVTRLAETDHGASNSALNVASGWEIFQGGTAKTYTDYQTTMPAMPQPYIFLPPGWDSHWQTTKANQAGTVMTVGPSQNQGNQQLSNIVTKRWPRLLLNWLHSTVGGPLVAETFTYTDNSNFVSPWSAGGTPPWAVGSLPSGDSNADGFYHRLNINSGTGSIMTMTTPFACTDADLYYLDLVSHSNTLTYKIDGGSSSSPISTNGDGTGKRIQITGMSNATHTIELDINSSTGGSNAIGFLGGTCYYQTTNARSTSGWTLANHTAGGEDNWNLYNVNSVANLYRLTRSTLGPIAQPDLLIVMCGGNEDANSHDPAYGMHWIIESCKYATANAISVIIVCEPDYCVALSDVGVSFGSGYGVHYGQTQHEMASYARANGYAFINIMPRWTAKPVAGGYIASGSGTGQPHPVDAGHADIATVIESIL